jgi:hypothetical protein
MKRLDSAIRFLPVLLLLIGLQSIYAETLYYRTKGKKIGMADKDGNIVIPVSYDLVEPWGNDYYRVQKGKKYGLYNKRGQIVVPISYSYISKLNDKGRALIVKGGALARKSIGEWQHNGRCGVLDGEAHIIVPCEHKGLHEFVFDASKVTAYGEGTSLEKDEAHSLMSDQYYRLAHFLGDTLVTDCQYLGVSDNQYKTENSGLLEVSTGRMLIPKKQFDIIFKPASGMSRYYATKRSNTTYGYVNIETGESFEVGSVDEKLDKLTHMTHSDFHGNVAAVNDGKAWHIINRSGQTLRNGYNKIHFDLAMHMWVGYREDGSLDVFDEDGRDRTGFQGYADIIFPDEMGGSKVFPVKNKENNWGLLNNEGSVVAPFDYQEVKIGSSDVLCVKKGELWGFMNSQGKHLTECKYVAVEQPVEHNPAYVWCKNHKGIWCRLNLNNKKELPTDYLCTEPFRDGLAWVKPKQLNIEGGVLNATLTTEKTDSVSEDKLGIIISEQGEVMFPEAVTSQFMPEVKAAITKKGKALSRAEAHSLLLRLSADKRMYPMNAKIDDNDWDF